MHSCIGFHFWGVYFWDPPKVTRTDSLLFGKHGMASNCLMVTRLWLNYENHQAPLLGNRLKITTCKIDAPTAFPFASTLVGDGDSLNLGLSNNVVTYTFFTKRDQLVWGVCGHKPQLNRISALLPWKAPRRVGLDLLVGQPSSSRHASDLGWRKCQQRSHNKAV